MHMLFTYLRNQQKLLFFGRGTTRRECGMLLFFISEKATKKQTAGGKNHLNPYFSIT